jgi:hypothetical protein
VYLPFSGGTVLLGTSRGGENKEERSVKRRVYDGVPTVSGGTVLPRRTRGGENKYERSVKRRVYDETGGKE